MFGLALNPHAVVRRHAGPHTKAALTLCFSSRPQEPPSEKPSSPQKVPVCEHSGQTLPLSVSFDPLAQCFSMPRPWPKRYPPCTHATGEGGVHASAAQEEVQVGQRSRVFAAAGMTSSARLSSNPSPSARDRLTQSTSIASAPQMRVIE